MSTPPDPGAADRVRAALEQLCRHHDGALYETDAEFRGADEAVCEVRGAAEALLAEHAALRARMERLEAIAASVEDPSTLGHAYDRARKYKAERDAARARAEAAEAALARWNDPDSDERQDLQNETLYAVGEGERSEIDLRESQLAATEAALAIVRARAEAAERGAQRKQDMLDGETALDWRGHAAKLERERDEARAVVNAWREATRLHLSPEEAGEAVEGYRAALAEAEAAIRVLADIVSSVADGREACVGDHYIYTPQIGVEPVKRALALPAVQRARQRKEDA